MRGIIITAMECHGYNNSASHTLTDVNLNALTLLNNNRAVDE